jgi:hypothetical protein
MAIETAVVCVNAITCGPIRRASRNDHVTVKAIQKNGIHLSSSFSLCVCAHHLTHTQYQSNGAPTVQIQMVAPRDAHFTSGPDGPAFVRCVHTMSAGSISSACTMIRPEKSDRSRTNCEGACETERYGATNTPLYAFEFLCFVAVGSRA